MRAQLRTYHSIPSLQTYNTDESDYKQLQDAPRLKSILKGACDDRPEPSTLEEMREWAHEPRTNPINLCFILSTFANRINDRFVPPYEFHDLFVNKTLSSASRGNAFLWLMWAYLETDLSPEALRQNPFGMGQEGGLKIPELVTLSPADQEEENIDPHVEIQFGETMTKERELYIEAAAQLPNLLPTAGGSGGGSGNTVKIKMREISSQRKLREAMTSDEGEIDDNDVNSRSPSPARLRLVLKAPNKKAARQKGDTNVIKTQAALREVKCQHEITKILRRKDRSFRRKRYEKGPVVTEWKRIKKLDPVYFSDDEVAKENDDVITYSMIPRVKRKRSDNDFDSVHGWKRHKLTSPGDYGEESSAMSTAFRRASRWLMRWEDNAEPVAPPVESEEQRAERRARQLEREKREIAKIEAQLEEEKQKFLLAQEQEQARLAEAERIADERETTGGKSLPKPPKAKKRKGKDGDGPDGDGDESTEKKKPGPKKPRKKKEEKRKSDPNTATVIIPEDSPLYYKAQSQSQYGGKSPVTNGQYGGKGPVAYHPMVGGKGPITSGQMGRKGPFVPSQVGGKGPVTSGQFGGKGPVVMNGQYGGKGPASYRMHIGGKGPGKSPASYSRAPVEREPLPEAATAAVVTEEPSGAIKYEEPPNPNASATGSSAPSIMRLGNLVD